MRKLILFAGILIVLICWNVCFSQAPVAGVITYEGRMNLHRMIPPDREDMKAMMPEYRTFKQQLFFNETASLYKPLIEDEDEEEINRGGGRMMFRSPRIEVYSELNSDISLSQQEFFGKTYLIEDTLQVDPWKFGTETKTIVGYECKQAYYTTTGERPQTITAWYCETLRAGLGPERFFSLPGAVLAVDTNSGERVIVAQKVELRPLKKNELKKPEKGEKVTRSQFKKITEEQRKRMGGGPGGNFGFRN